jgi:hypothetical protein
MSKRACHGTTQAGKQAGKPCGANPLKPGTVIQGVTVTGDWCREHDVDLPTSARIRNTRTREQLGGRPRNPRPSEIKRQLMERYELAVQRPYWRTLGYDVVINESGECELVELPTGGAKLFGESKDGCINVSDVEDLNAMIAAAEKLEDRVYGRPKQSSEVTVVTQDTIEQAIERMEGELAGNDPTGPEHPAGADRAVQAATGAA